MVRARPAPLPAELPDAGTARRRARTGVCLLGALLVLPFTVGGGIRTLDHIALSVGGRVEAGWATAV